MSYSRLWCIRLLFYSRLCCPCLWYSESVCSTTVCDFPGHVCSITCHTADCGALDVYALQQSVMTWRCLFYSRHVLHLDKLYRCTVDCDAQEKSVLWQPVLSLNAYVLQQTVLPWTCLFYSAVHGRVRSTIDCAAVHVCVWSKSSLSCIWTWTVYNSMCCPCAFLFYSRLCCL